MVSKIGYNRFSTPRLRGRELGFFVMRYALCTRLYEEGGLR
jgi:hypothetical protein